MDSITVSLPVPCWNCFATLRIRMKETDTYASGLCGCCGALIEINTEE